MKTEKNTRAKELDFRTFIDSLSHLMKVYLNSSADIEETLRRRDEIMGTFLNFCENNHLITDVPPSIIKPIETDLYWRTN